MHSIATIFKKLSIYGAALIIGSFTALAGSGLAFADTTCTPPPNDQNGVHWPVGADAGTFTYQCDGPYAGYWTNAYYKYDPITATRYALYAPDYSYDCATNTWTMTEWDYSPGTGTFVESRVVPSTAPNLPTGCPAPAPVAPAASTGGSGGGTVGSATTNGIANTGPGSTNSTGNNVTLNGTTTNNTNLSMSNGLFSNATTGNTFVIGNTTGGDATSGNAQAIANIANLLQSTSNVFGGAVTFTANINGDVNGDFMFDPSAILNTGPNSNNTASNNLTVNTNNANDTNAQINNTVDVGATSGNATVGNNTTGGNATSGNATAIVNLMNLINSVVASGKSFIGTININGNLNGDILLPQNLVDQLLASTGPSSTNTAGTNLTDNSTTTNNVNQNIANNITTAAATGNATVSGNTTGGSATSGSARTGLTVLNLTGSDVIGSNDLLVFVNVLGTWVGMIVNAPAGTTAAELGGGITNTGPSSTNTTATNVTNNSTTTNNTGLGIVNNVNAHAQTGDATVADNTTGGNARSGNANTAVNILNLEGSNLSLSNWFGILFINVFGNWFGSFGVNTSAGDPVSTGSSAQTASSASGSPSIAPQTFVTFLARPHGASTGSATTTGVQSNSTSPIAAVLGSSTAVAKKIATALPTPDNGTHANLLLPIIGGSAAFLILLAGERDRIFHRKH